MTADGSIDLRSQLRLHLESLQAAGVLFVPIAPAIAIQIAPATTERRLLSAVPEPTIDPLEARKHSLTLLEEEVAKCDRCSELFSTRTQPVFGVGPLNPEVAFVGEAPGPDEDAQGQPFVGKGGQLLGRIIAACGFTRESVYLFNVIKCRPPKNRTPTTTECGNCRDFFRRQFELVKPKHLVAIGLLASRLLTGQNAALTTLRAKVHEYRGIPLICTHHPDELERDTTGGKKRDTWEDMKLLLNTMGRPVPSAK